MKSIILTILLFSFQAIAEKKIIIKYKQYEKFDLGNMEVKGNILAPGDISVNERSRKIFDLDMMRKTNFDSKIITDIKFIK